MGSTKLETCTMIFLIDFNPLMPGGRILAANLFKYV